MASTCYWLAMKLYGLILSIISPFHKKASLLIRGRKESVIRIKSIPKTTPGQKCVWFHFASLGEFEQGRPVLEAIRSSNQKIRIIVTFYSPSGYEIRKNTPLADFVFYLPADTAANARLVVNKLNPDLVIFTKYEYWPFYFRQIQRSGKPLYLISAIFRPQQVFFKWYGGFFRRTLNCVTHFFTQNESSIKLLAKLGLNNASIAGDTRFDRVIELPQNRKELPLVRNFIGNSLSWVAGSTWPEDEKILARLQRENPEWRFIVAPHEIHEGHIREIERIFQNTIRYSLLETSNIENKKVLIIDNIGLLSSLYGYGKIAYIGGGFGSAGIHNTLEAATYGIPVFFGPNYYKFEEAKGLIKENAAFSIHNESELLEISNKMAIEDMRNPAGKNARAFVVKNAGATSLIYQSIKKQLGSDTVCY